MKPSRLLLLCFITLFSGSYIIAQVRAGNENFQGRSMTVDGGIMANQVNRGGLIDIPDNVEGSQYWKDEYEKATIFVNDNPKTQANIRYNAFADYLEIMEGGRVMELMKRDYISAELDGKRVRYLEYKEGNKVITGYLVALAEGELSFYMKPAKVYNPEKKARSNYDKNIPPSFSDKYTYYLKKGEGPIERVKVNSRFMKDLFQSDYGKVMAYAKEQGLDEKEASDLAQLIAWYNAM